MAAAGGTLLEEPDVAPPDFLPPEDGDGGDGGGGGGGDSPPPPGDGLPISMSRLATLFLLAMVVMLFAGFASSFVIIESGERASARPVLPKTFFVSTGIIALSSVAAMLATRAARQTAPARMFGFVVTTLCLGVIFCLFQIDAWTDLWRTGITPRTDNYAGNFYAITVLHAAHVLGGIVWVLVCASRLRRDGLDAHTLESWGNASLYWHFVGVIWYALFFLLLR